MNRERRTIWIVDAHRGDGQRFIVRADEKLTAFLELEGAIATAPNAEEINWQTPSPGPQKSSQENLFHPYYVLSMQIERVDKVNS